MSTNPLIRAQMIKEIKEAETPEMKELLESLLNLYDMGFVEVSFDEQTGECVYQATQQAIEYMGETK